MLILKKIHKFKNKIILYGILIVCAVITVVLVNHDEKFYHNTIAKVITVKEVPGTSSKADNKKINEQKLTVRILNTDKIGKILELNNLYTETGAYDYKFRVGDKLFLTLTTSSTQELSATIAGVKRDYYLVITAWIFLVFIILIGKRKGFLSTLSLLVNIIVFYYALELYRNGMNLILLSGILAIIFTTFSMLMVMGNNKKSYSAILSTIVATLFTMIITFLVMIFTQNNGLRFEEMQFITRPIYPIFMAEILLGSLGAIMDIAITISSSMFELHDNNVMTQTALIESGREIGRDIMGSMCNVLLLAYVSGSFPMILLYMKNGMPVFNAFYSNLSLELVRALTGSIGIVLAIPISIYSTMFFLKKKNELSL